ncbi:MAG: TIGR03643 family protein [Flavobacteriales bacterium]|nr:TIGR03643 family protein [Flavobacteriales bacterium]
MKISERLNKFDIDRIIQMAWEDRTPFEAIRNQFGLHDNQVKKILKKSLKLSSYILWRKRVQGRKTKHSKTNLASRFKSKNQKN